MHLNVLWILYLKKTHNIYLNTKQTFPKKTLQTKWSENKTQNDYDEYLIRFCDVLCLLNAQKLLLGDTIIIYMTKPRHDDVDAGSYHYSGGYRGEATKTFRGNKWR